MRQVPERFRQAAERPMVELPGLPPRHARRALVRSVATMMQARRLVEELTERLADLGWLDPAGGDAWANVHLRDPAAPEWIVCQPILARSWAQGIGAQNMPAVPPEVEQEWLPADAPDDWKPGDPHWDPDNFRPDIVPRGDAMHGGRLKFADGPSTYEIGYGDDGCMAETVQSGGDSFSGWFYGGCRPHLRDPDARPPQIPPHWLLLRPDLDVQGWPVSKLAQVICEQWPTVSGRLQMPVPVPGGAAGVWNVATRAMKQALFDGQVPTQKGFLAADGLAGTAVAWGASLGEAVAAWQLEVRRLKPKSPAMSQKPMTAAQQSQQMAMAAKQFAEHDKRRAEMVAKIMAEDEREDAETNVRPLRKSGVDPKTGEVIGRDGQVKGKQISLGTFTVQFGGPNAPGPQAPTLPWPVPVPANTPIGLTPLPQPPELPEAWRLAGFSQLVRSVNDWGEVTHGWRRDDPNGCTIVGEFVLADLDPRQLDAEISEIAAKSKADLAQMPAEMRAMWAMHQVQIVQYAVAPAKAGRGPRLAQTGSAGTDEWNWGNLPTGFAWQVVRVNRQ